MDFHADLYTMSSPTRHLNTMRRTQTELFVNFASFDHTMFILLLLIILCSSAKLLARTSALSERSRAYERARERTSAHESRSGGALDYVLYPSFSRPKSPALPRTAGEPWAERVHRGSFAATAGGDLPL